MSTRYGKHGEFRPTETWQGTEIQHHFHTIGVGDGYYVIIEPSAHDLADNIKKEVQDFIDLNEPYPLDDTDTQVIEGVEGEITDDIEFETELDDIDES